MATSILLLDCSEDLANKLRSFGHDVHVGTSGACTGIRKFPCQVYEVDLVIYNPLSVPVKFGLRGSLWDKTTAEIDTSYEAMMEHVAADGHWLVFLNRVTDSLAQQQRLYHWVPGQPIVQFTLDQKIKKVKNLSGWISRFSPLLDSARTARPLEPARLKLSGWNLNHQRGSGGFTPLLQNLRGEALGGVASILNGSMTFLPACGSNDNAAVFYLDHIWPQLKPSASPRGGIPERFKSPLEDEIHSQLEKMMSDYMAMENVQHDLQRKAAEARHAKIATITGDETAQRILGYYREAEEDQKDAPKHLYKVRDAIRIRFGGEVAAKTALGDCNAEWKCIGLMTNGPDRDERHPPELGQVPKPLTPEEMNQCFAAAKKMILAYFRTLFPQALPPAPPSTT